MLMQSPRCCSRCLPRRRSPRDSRGPRRKPRCRGRARAGGAGGGRRGAPFTPKFFTRTRVANRAGARRHHHSAGRAIGQRDRCRRARVHGLHDARPADAAGRRCVADWRGSTSSVEQRFDKTFVDAPRLSGPPCSTTSRGRRGDGASDTAPPAARRRVLQQLPRSDRDRLLDHAHGDRRSALHGQSIGRAVERLSGRGAEEAGRQVPGVVGGFSKRQKAQGTRHKARAHAQRIARSLIPATCPWPSSPGTR